MSELVLFLVLGGVLLALLVWTLLRGAPLPEAQPASLGRLAQMVALPGLSFPAAERLFDSAEHAALRELPGLARELRAERRRLALLWLRLLRRDVHTLWRFRRLLAVHGVSSGVAEEFRVGASGLWAVTVLMALRLAVALLGPFAVAQFCQTARVPVETIWRSSARLFNQLPAAHLSEFERLWIAARANFPILVVR